MIPVEHLIIESWPPRNVGGQQVEHSHGVKITHTPSGLIALSAECGSQRRNKQVAVDMILGGLTSPHFR